MSGEPGKEELEREFRGWHFWEGVAGLKYARKPMTSPPVVVRGEDWLDLRDQINGYLGRTAPTDVAGAGQGEIPGATRPGHLRSLGDES